ncbi:glycoside hydrolase family 13 protein [Brachybacterium sp. J153]|uniref:glycoside hydrolase family 13 protein n=1 Tax=Brachybacterium sp. J153 TaxID=3116488 RepID=UPI002E772C0E|nr:glycoside hydrolase family 13 protein [Brachybacterium sp. J153]MEE1619664.1 glycoside hydrolase family 13 protein [Brachybacterium sp. J153]
MSTDTLNALVPPGASTTDRDWWRQAVVYQVYPRSFADGNGDGIGDLTGLRSRVPYLTELGIDAVWLSPFYPSALADGGYDVADYRDVDPRIGTLEDFDGLVAALHAEGIRLIVDIVPNHSSDQHPWFQEALASPRGSAARERYIFRDGKGEDGELPPADWPSTFGGPGWTRVADGQWYLHTFAKEQPDWNWDNPEVREDFLTTLRFWADRGVDGFRVDVAQLLVKDLPAELPSWDELQAMDADHGTHPLQDRDELQDVYAQWREVFEEYDTPRVAVAEAHVSTPERRARYASSASLGQAFNFDLMWADFDASSFRSVVEADLEQSARTGSSSTWVLSNHDATRHATRYGLPPAADTGRKAGTAWMLEGAPRAGVDLQLGTRRARAATLFLLGLPGSAYLYQGEELGLHEVGDIPADARQDPAFLRCVETQEWSHDGLGRDGCRVPLPWTSEGPSFGFGTGSAHLPQPAWFAQYSVEAEQADPGSTLSLYRRALRLRHKLQTSETLEWLETGHEDVLRFRRPNGWEIVTNFGTEPVALPTGQFVLASDPIEDQLPGATTVWLRSES